MKLFKIKISIRFENGETEKIFNPKFVRIKVTYRLRTKEEQTEEQEIFKKFKD